MTSRQDDPPLTRREARERERTLAGELGEPTNETWPPSSQSLTEAHSGPTAIARRAAVAEPISGGEIPRFDKQPTGKISIAHIPHPDPATGMTRRQRREHAEQQNFSTSETVSTNTAANTTVTGPAEKRESAAPTPAPVAPSSPVISAPTSASPGHWSIGMTSQGAGEKSKALPLSGFGSNPTTASALILPVLPEQGSKTTVAPSGEILITGSIDLPRSYGSTGAHPSHIDSSEVDRLLDKVEDASSTGVSPVSASKAVSTHSTTGAVITAPKKSGVSVPIVLAITAGALALCVVGVLVAGYIFHIF